MAKRNINTWSVCKGLAGEILHQRCERRRFMAKLLMLALAMMAAGLWLFEPWLAANLWRFFLWWAACAVITFLTMLFALYDALAVVREERARQPSRPDHS